MRIAVKVKRDNEETLTLLPVRLLRTAASEPYMVIEIPSGARFGATDDLFLKLLIENAVRNGATEEKFEVDNLFGGPPDQVWWKISGIPSVAQRRQRSS